MIATIKGIVSGIQSGDAITIIEVVWKLRTSTGPDVYESSATAQTAGRGIILTSLADRTALSSALTLAGQTLNSGIVDANIVYGSAGQTALTAYWNAATPSLAGSGYSLTEGNGGAALINGSTYTPSVRVYESRNSGADAGPYTGGWVDQTPFTAIPIATGTIYQSSFAGATIGAAPGAPWGVHGTSNTATIVAQPTGHIEKAISFGFASVTQGSGLYIDFPSNVTSGSIEFDITPAAAKGLMIRFNNDIQWVTLRATAMSAYNDYFAMDLRNTGVIANTANVTLKTGGVDTAYSNTKMTLKMSWDFSVIPLVLSYYKNGVEMLPQDSLASQFAYGTTANFTAQNYVNGVSFQALNSEGSFTTLISNIKVVKVS